MDLQSLQLNNGSIHQKTSKHWIIHEIILNFFDKNGNRHGISLNNVESSWPNRSEGQSNGYKFHSGKWDEHGPLYQFWHHSLEKQQEWGDAGNTHHARAPLHLEPKNDDWKSWFNENCTFIGFTFSMWPQDQSNGSEGDSVVGVGGNSWKACLFKRLRFVEEFPDTYHTSFPVEVCEDNDW